MEPTTKKKTGSSTGKRGGRKIGRSMRLPSHSRYVNEGRREQNKIRRIKKHLKRCENDQIARKALRKLI